MKEIQPMIKPVTGIEVTQSEELVYQDLILPRTVKQALELKCTSEARNIYQVIPELLNSAEVSPLHCKESEDLVKRDIIVHLDDFPLPRSISKVVEQKTSKVPYGRTKVIRALLRKILKEQEYLK